MQNHQLKFHSCCFFKFSNFCKISRAPAISLHSGNKFPSCSAAQQVGNLSAHALQFARFKRKRLGASKYSNLIFERFIGVFRSFFLLTKKLLIYCIVGNTRKV